MTEKQRAAIQKHGEALLAIFPEATERDPVTLCKRLRRIEGSAHRHAERRCNEDVPDRECERVKTLTANKLAALLGSGSDRIWLNGDPRGYALKVDLRKTPCGKSLDDTGCHCPAERLHTDWGGYGIIAPEIGPDGN